MRHEAEAKGERRNRGVRAQSASALQCAGVATTMMRGPSGFCLSDELGGGSV
jgi:hypothetical protein